jgi:hypothetical protein
MKRLVTIKDAAELDRKIAIEIFDLPHKEGWKGSGELVDFNTNDPIWLNSANLPVSCPRYSRDLNVTFNELVPWLIKEHRVFPHLITNINEQNVITYGCELRKNGSLLTGVESHTRTYPWPGVAIAAAAMAYYEMIND